MPITLEEFIHAYPTLFHVSLARDMGQISRHGLLSTSALLDLCEVNGADRFGLCRAALKSWTGPCVFSMIFLVLNGTVMCFKSWTTALELRTNRQTNFVHDLNAEGRFSVGTAPQNHLNPAVVAAPFPFRHPTILYSI
jgi:hypothetical protein